MQRHLSKLFGLAAFALTAPIATARGQYPETRVGERIRVEAPGIVAERYTGTVLHRTADSLLIGSGNAPALSLALARITRMHMSRGRSSFEGAMRGLLIGAGAGAVAGAVTSAQILSDEKGGLAALAVPVILVLEVALCGMVGASIGSVVKREVWNSYTPTETPIGVAVHSGMVQVGVRLVR